MRKRASGKAEQCCETKKIKRNYSDISTRWKFRKVRILCASRGRKKTLKSKLERVVLARNFSGEALAPGWLWKCADGPTTPRLHLGRDSLTREKRPADGGLRNDRGPPELAAVTVIFS